MATPSHPPATLEDLAVLNREIAALVRAGLPLEAGLAQVARDFSGSTAQLAAALQAATSSGKTLAEAVDEQGDALPLIYRATVAAGLRSGHLASALEGMAEASIRAGNLRRLTLQSLTYPLLVVVCAWVFFVFVAAVVHPSFEEIEMPTFGPTAWLRLTGWPLWLVIFAVPVVLLLCGATWWRWSGRAGRSPFGWIPGARRSRQLSGQANFADLLRTMLSADVPLHEALPLAADASDLPGVQLAAHQLAQTIRCGEPLTSDLAAVRGLPPLVRLALLGGGSLDGTFRALHRAAATYHERAEAWVGSMAFALPIAATLGLGGTVVFVYAAVALAPYLATLYELSRIG